HPERGNIRVEFRDGRADGVTGVMANVVSFITGATAESGFKGLGGRFDRRKLLFFDVPMATEIRFERLDTGDRVGVDYHAGIVPASPEMMPALQGALRQPGEAGLQEEFGRLWQDRVRRIFE